MKRWEIIYDKASGFTAMSYWVHIGVDEKIKGYSSCDTFIPPMPSKVPGKGYPLLQIYALGDNFAFASMAELEHCIEVLGQKNMPTTRALSAQRGTKVGPNKHWLSRFPAKYKPWRKREKLVKILKKVKIEIEQQGINL